MERGLPRIERGLPWVESVPWMERGLPRMERVPLDGVGVPLQGTVSAAPASVALVGPSCWPPCLAWLSLSRRSLGWPAPQCVCAHALTPPLPGHSLSQRSCSQTHGHVVQVHVCLWFYKGSCALFVSD